MIRDRKAWEAWEREQRKAVPADLHLNLRLVEALYAEARELDVWTSSDPLEGLDAKIRLARILNVSGPAGDSRARA